MGLRVSSLEFYPLIGTVVGNPKGWVCVDFGDMYASKSGRVRGCRESKNKVSIGRRAMDGWSEAVDSK